MVNDKILRIIDANLNRSREGLRVCEEITRFMLNSPGLTKKLKSARHAISDIGSKAVPQPYALVSARDSKDDVLRSSKTRGELKRDSVRDLFLANCERAKESVRVLEEFFKLIDKAASSRYSGLRFRLYDIEKQAIEKIEAL